MQNPVREVREEHKLTIKAFASLAGVTEHVVIRAEGGMFGSLPPSILRSVEVLTGDKPDQITAAYERWVEYELSQVQLPAAKLDHMIEEPISFQDWMVIVCDLNDVPKSAISFCKLFKMHPYVIEKWINGKLKSAPLQLVQRLAHMRGIL